MSDTSSDNNTQFEKNLLYKASWYYYMEGLTQQAIAEKLNISRIKVLRLLDRARQEGIVQIHIKPDTDEFLSMEQELIHKYHLKDCYIVPAGSGKDNQTETVAKAAAMYIQNHITDNCYINFGYGETVMRTLSHLSRCVSATISLVSLTGGITNYLPDAHSRIYGAKLYLYPSPLIMSSKELAASMMEEASLTEISKMTELANLTLIGIGGMNTDATILKSSRLTNNDYLLLKMQGAVGDLITHFIDAQGRLVNSDFDARIISTPLEKLKSLNNVIGAATGVEKLPAIAASLTGSYLDILITDDITAKQLLNNY